MPSDNMLGLALLLAAGLALQVLCLFCGRGWPARAALLCGGVLVCIYAAWDRDITFAIGQVGFLYVLWRMRFSAAKPPEA